MNDRIRRVMAQALEVSEESITEETNMDAVESWDSLHHVRLIVLLEREFDISIPDDIVGNMISYNLIKSVIDDLA
jgi:acyl carrier protein